MRSCHVRVPVPWLKPWEPPALTGAGKGNGGAASGERRLKMRGRNSVKLNS